MHTIQNYIDRFTSIRNKTMQICEPLEEEDYVVQPMIDVSPPKWHLGHTTWFFETFILIPYCDNYKIYKDDFAFVFNSYYETLGKRVLRADRGNLSRPTVKEVFKYREYVDEMLLKYLSSNLKLNEVAPVLEIGLQHEQQHQELLVTDIKYILGNNPLFPVYSTLEENMKKDLNLEVRELEVPEGIYEIGYAGSQFCFDNELGKHKVYLQGFTFEDRLITNAEYLSFMADGGYRDFRYWLLEGWEYVKSEKLEAPLYWYNVDGKWQNYTLRGFEDIQLDAPVTHISFYEADAYARWRGKRLLTEFEWEAACKMYSPLTDHMGNFQDNGIYLPTPRIGSNTQMLGDAWEWTNSAYLPYPYYQKADGALGEYNGKFMINQMVLRGGSCATPSDHMRISYRNFFHPDKRWQFTGIRLAKTL